MYLIGHKSYRRWNIFLQSFYLNTVIFTEHLSSWLVPSPLAWQCSNLPYLYSGPCSASTASQDRTCSHILPSVLLLHKISSSSPGWCSGASSSVCIMSLAGWKQVSNSGLKKYYCNRMPMVLFITVSILWANALWMKTVARTLMRPAMKDVTVRGKKTQDTEAMLRRAL